MLGVPLCPIRPRRKKLADMQEPALTTPSTAADLTRHHRRRLGHSKTTATSFHFRTQERGDALPPGAAPPCCHAKRSPTTILRANLDEDARCDLQVLVIDVEMLGKDEEELGRVYRLVPETMMQLIGNLTASKRRRSCPQGWRQ